MNANEQIMKKANKYLITSMLTKLQPLVISKGKGASIFDQNGKEYIDCFAGIAVVNAGHNHSMIANAAIDQIKKLVHACTYVYYIPTVIDLAEKLAEITPKDLTKTFFGNSGAEAIECAIKLARKYSKKHEIVSLMCSFHGRTLGTLSITGQAKRKRYDMGPYSSGVAFAHAPYCYRCPFEQEYPNCGLLCARNIQDIIDYCTSNNVAAFIAEPIMGEGGILVPPKEYFAIAKKVLKANDILFIADEVQSGFGRTGKLFGFEHYDVEPDLITMAKGIANGFPISACTTRADIGNSFEPGDHLSTFGGNPVSAAAAIANIQVLLKERLPDQAASKGQYVMKRLEELKEKHELIGDIRGKGLMIGIELVIDQNKKTPAVGETAKIRELLLKDGVVVGAGGVKGNVLRIQPPLVIAEEQLEQVIRSLDKVLRHHIK